MFDTLYRIHYGRLRVMIVFVITFAQVGIRCVREMRLTNKIVAKITNPSH